MSTALGIAPDADNNGVTPLTHRKIIDAQWGNTGVISGLSVSGGNSLSYTVAPGVAVCSRGATDGKTIAYWAGGTTGPVAAGDSSFPRIDLVWITAHNKVEYNDKDNAVTIGVTSGTPAADPAMPSLPSGCTLLAAMRLPAGATNTGKAVTVRKASAAIQSSGARGRIAYQLATGTHSIYEDYAWHQEVAVAFTLPTKRHITIKQKVRAVCTAGQSSGNNTIFGSWYSQMRVDGKIINDLQNTINSSGKNEYCEEWTASRYCETKQVEYDLDLEAGNHTAAMWSYGNNKWLTYPVTMYWRALEIIDNGAAS